MARKAKPSDFRWTEAYLEKTVPEKSLSQVIQLSLNKWRWLVRNWQLSTDAGSDDWDDWTCSESCALCSRFLVPPNPCGDCPLNDSKTPCVCANEYIGGAFESKTQARKLIKRLEKELKKAKKIEKNNGQK